MSGLRISFHRVKSWVRSLDCSHVFIQSQHAVVSPRSVSLLELKLVPGPLAAAEAATVELHDLYLTGNALTSFPDALLTSLGKLRYLHVEDNALTRIPFLSSEFVRFTCSCALSVIPRYLKKAIWGGGTSAIKFAVTHDSCASFVCPRLAQRKILTNPTPRQVNM